MRFAVTILLCGGLAAQSVTLTDLPRIARARAERQRPAQEQALQPFWKDLELDYDTRGNSEYLDPRIREVAELGDSVVPLLLEKLDPEHGTAGQRQLAANCARVLALLDPASFIDALIELATASRTEARGHAIRLLGQTRSPRAVQVLSGLLGELQSEADTVGALEALTRLGDPAAAEQAAALLDSGVRVRRAALAYLNASGPVSVVDPVRRALESETEPSLFRGYIDYLGGVVRSDAAIAVSLLPLLDRAELLRADQIALCEALAAVAPKDHTPTTEALRRILEGGHTGELGRAAAVALYKLGDLKGAEILLAKLEADVRRNRGDWTALMERAELYFALEMWLKAIADYQQASRVGRRETRTASQLRIARCEARLRRWRNVLVALRDSGAQRASILREAEQDPALQEALEQEIVQRWFATLSG